MMTAPNNIDVITAKEWLDCEHQLGEYMTDNDYDILVEEDMDTSMLLQGLARVMAKIILSSNIDETYSALKNKGVLMMV